MWNQSLAAPVTLSGVGKHMKYKKYTLIIKVAASVFYFSVKNRVNLITSLHSFVCLECHLLFSVTRFAKISAFPYQHLLSAGLDFLSLKPICLVCFFHLSLLLFFSPLSCVPRCPCKMFSWNTSRVSPREKIPLGCCWVHLSKGKKSR